jgi:hypothetical protein
MILPRVAHPQPNSVSPYTSQDPIDHIRILLAKKQGNNKKKNCEINIATNKQSAFAFDILLKL